MHCLFSGYYDIEFLTCYQCKYVCNDVEPCTQFVEMNYDVSLFWYYIARFDSKQFITTHNIETVNDMVFSHDYDCISLQTT